MGKVSLHNLASRVGEMVSMDGFELKVYDQNDKLVSTKYIQCVDHFSRYKTIRRVHGFTGREGARVLSDHISDIGRNPEIMCGDQGNEIIGKEVDYFCRRRGIT